MGQKDYASKRFFGNKHVFADLINNYIFNGKQMVQAESMQDRDVEAIIENFGSAKLQGKYRDLLKQVEIKADALATYVLIGIENQAEVDYTIPVRILLYDALEYEKQREEAMNSYRAEGRSFASRAEFLSGLPKGTVFKPVITLIMYLGSGTWDGPRSLYDNLPCEVPEEIKSYINNWHVPIIEPGNMSDENLEKYETELGLVLKFLKYSNNKLKLLDKIRNDARFTHVSRDALVLMNSVSRHKLKLVASEAEEGYNMCKAIDDLIKESVAEGVQIGEARGEVRGKARGREEQAKETALTLRSMGMAIENIAKAVHVNEGTVKEWLGVAVL